MPGDVFPRVAAAVADVEGLSLQGSGHAMQLRVRSTRPASATVTELLDRVRDEGLRVAYLVHGTTPYQWTTVRLYDDDPQEHFVVVVSYFPR